MDGQTDGQMSHFYQHSNFSHAVKQLFWHLPPEKQVDGKAPDILHGPSFTAQEHAPSPICVRSYHSLL